MFTIYGDRTSFYQWDLNQKLIISDTTINEVHFCNKTSDCSLVCEVFEENGLRLVNVPNILLQTDWPINVYLYCTNHTVDAAVFKVHPRSKPDAYVYTETEIKTFAALEARMDAVEDMVSEDSIAQAVSDYMEENPFNVPDDYVTEEELKQYVSDAIDIVETKIFFIDIWGYAIGKSFEARQDVLDCIEYLSTHKDAVVYMNTTNNRDDYMIASISRLNGENRYYFTSQSPVSAEAVEGEYSITDRLDIYMLNSTWLIQRKHYSVKIASVDYVDEAIAGISSGGGGGSADMSNYYTKTEVNTLIKDYCTETQVNTLIENALSELTNGDEVSY